jgi:hypothetical protein
LKNDKSSDIVNGDLATVISINEKEECLTLLVDRTEKVVELGRAGFSKTEYVIDEMSGELVAREKFSVSAIPVKLAYGITIHKSQGLSIPDLVVNAGNIFAESQLYVALSRSSDPDRLSIDYPNIETIREGISLISPVIAYFYDVMLKNGDLKLFFENEVAQNIIKKAIEFNQVKIKDWDA